MIDRHPASARAAPGQPRRERQISGALAPNVNRVIKKTIPMPPSAPTEPPVIYSISRNLLNYLNFLSGPSDRDGFLKVSVQ